MTVYAAEIWAQIERHRPKSIHWSGIATVQFSLSASGTLLQVEIVHTSGNAHLDQAALDTIRSAAPFPPPPSGASENNLAFTVPFQFR